MEYTKEGAYKLELSFSEGSFRGITLIEGENGAERLGRLGICLTNEVQAMEYAKELSTEYANEGFEEGTSISVLQMQRNGERVPYREVSSDNFKYDWSISWKNIYEVPIESFIELDTLTVKPKNYTILEVIDSKDTETGDKYYTMLKDPIGDSYSVVKEAKEEIANLYMTNSEKRYAVVDNINNREIVSDTWDYMEEMGISEQIVEYVDKPIREHKDDLDDNYEIDFSDFD